MLDLDTTKVNKLTINRDKKPTTLDSTPEYNEGTGVGGWIVAAVAAVVLVSVLTGWSADDTADAVVMKERAVSAVDTLTEGSIRDRLAATVDALTTDP